MRPSAHLAAAVDILDEILGSRRAAARILERWGRANRYAGSRDRRLVSGRVYLVLRHAMALGHYGAVQNARELVLASLRRCDGLPMEALERLLGTEPHALAPLSDEERTRLTALTPLSEKEAPFVRGNYPAWLHDRLVSRFGCRLEAEMTALNQPAPVDLRVNRLRATPDMVCAELARNALEAAPLPWSPIGLRLETRSSLGTMKAFKKGWFEIQDEGSQLVAALVGAKPGECVVDYCAGAGGKTLAIGADMKNEGQLLACDTDSNRLARLGERARRAGLNRLAVRVLGAGGLEDFAGQADRLVLDVPCSGTGTWRRQPEGRLRLTEKELGERRVQQADILEKSHIFLRPGGRLVYSTCSLLEEENEAQIEAFLKKHPGYRLCDWRQCWPSGWRQPPAGEGACFRASPATTGTDGFFVAILERGEAGAPSPGTVFPKKEGG